MILVKQLFKKMKVKSVFHLNVEVKLQKGYNHQEKPSQPTSLAQLDARPTDDQKVAASIPATFFRGDLTQEIFSMVILSLPLIQEGQLSISGERMCPLLVNRLED